MSGAEKKKILLLSPIFPITGGQGGPVIRTANIARTLALNFDLHHFVILHSRKQTLRLKRAGDFVGNIEKFPLSLSRDLWLITKLFWKRNIVKSKLPIFAGTYSSGGRLRSLEKQFGGRNYDIAFACRTVMAPYALHLKKNAIAGCVALDVDDIESETLERFSRLARFKKQFVLALRYKKLAQQYRKFENLYFPRFDLLYVCSGTDRDKLLDRFPTARVEILPNVINPPRLLKESRNKVFTFGFIGSLGYFPNHDAISFFCEVILPVIERRTKAPFQLVIAGKGLPKPLEKKLKIIPGRNIVGWVDDLSKFYINVDAVIVPIRVGGGTRIKVLEAFAYKKPVIATSIGIEGIRAVPDSHFLLGDSPEDFADQCLQVMADENLRLKISGNAFELFTKSYTIDNLKEILSPENIACGSWKVDP